MKTRSLVLLAAILPLFSCRFISDDTLLPGTGREDNLNPSPPSSADDSGERAGRRDTTVYVTAVEYPEGVDWVKSDRARGCKLVLFRDGERVFDIPVGDEYLSSHDADMHRVCEGAFYYDFSTDSETVVSKDGKQLFRYPGRESLRGFLVDGDDVWTLGQSRSGEGWSLRKNGVAVASSENGLLLQDASGHSFPGGALQRDEGHIVFFWHIPLRSELGTRPGEYFICRDGVSEPLTLPPGVSKVFDIRLIGGKTVICYEGSYAPQLSIDGELFAPGTPGTNVLHCAIYPAGETEVRIVGKVRYYGGDWTFDNIWDRYGRLSQLREGSVLGECAFDVDEENWVYGNTEGYADKLYRRGNVVELPKDSRFAVRRCFLRHGGRIYIALSGRASGGTVSGLWRDGEFSPYGINGPLTGVFVEP